MRALCSVILLAALVAAGCTGQKPGAPPKGSAPDARFSPLTDISPPNQKLIVTPEEGLAGKVALVNSVGRFVVLNFPVGHLPAVEQVLNVYRRGLKVGEVRVTNAQLDDNVVADIVSGEAVVGDAVRDK
jgi:hypothetical protein